MHLSITVFTVSIYRYILYLVKYIKSQYKATSDTATEACATTMRRCHFFMKRNILYSANQNSSLHTVNAITYTPYSTIILYSTKKQG